jgi:hypothetical protein
MGPRGDPIAPAFINCVRLHTERYTVFHESVHAKMGSPSFCLEYQSIESINIIPYVYIVYQ